VKTVQLIVFNIMIDYIEKVNSCINLFYIHLLS